MHDKLKEKEKSKTTQCEKIGFCREKDAKLNSLQNLILCNEWLTLKRKGYVSPLVLTSMRNIYFNKK